MAAKIGPMALMNVYTATKEFIKYFSIALRYEYKSKGIIVQTVYPGLVVSNMSGIHTPYPWVPLAESYAYSAVATTGIQNETCGCIAHALQDCIISVFPQWWNMAGAYQFFSMRRRQRLAAARQKKH